MVSLELPQPVSPLPRAHVPHLAFSLMPFPSRCTYQLLWGAELMPFTDDVLQAAWVGQGELSVTEPQASTGNLTLPIGCPQELSTHMMLGTSPPILRPQIFHL